MAVKISANISSRVQGWFVVVITIIAVAFLTNPTAVAGSSKDEVTESLRKRYKDVRFLKEIDHFEYIKLLTAIATDVAVAKGGAVQTYVAGLASEVGANVGEEVIISLLKGDKSSVLVNGKDVYVGIATYRHWETFEYPILKRNGRFGKGSTKIPTPNTHQFYIAIGRNDMRGDIGHPGDSPGLYFREKAEFHLGNRAGLKFREPVQFGDGDNTWEVMVGNWDGSGIDKPILYNRSAAAFYRGNWDGSSSGEPVQFGDGDNTWEVMVGNWDGSGIDKPILYDRSAAAFHRGNWDGSSSGGPVQFGNANNTWEVMVGNWDGSGIDKPILYNRNTASFDRGNWDGSSHKDSVQFGDGDNKWDVMVGDLDGTGVDSPILYDRHRALFLFGDWGGKTVHEQQWGNAGTRGIPLVGKWWR